MSENICIFWRLQDNVIYIQRFFFFFVGLFLENIVDIVNNQLFFKDSKNKILGSIQDEIIVQNLV